MITMLQYFTHSPDHHLNLSL